MSLKSTIRRISSSRWTAEAIAVLAGFAYLVQAVIYAHSQESILDEGAYLYKGYLFATGRYTPYQDYGPWSNHMPLSFLIPGAVQVLIEPGLRTARYFAIFLGLLMLESGMGKTIHIIAEGDDAEQAMDAICNLINARFDEDC